MNKQLQHQLYQLARALRKAHIHHLITTKLLTPLNYQKEQERFFSSRRYNPQFVYDIPDHESFDHTAAEFEKELVSLSLAPEVTEYIRAYIENTLLLARTRAHIGTEPFASFAEKLFSFGPVSTRLIYTTVPRPNLLSHRHPTVHNAQALQKIFAEHIRSFSPIVDSYVEIDHYNDHTIRVGIRRLTIGSAVRRSEINVRRLIVHEIESHMLQRYNLTYMKNPLLRLAPFHLSQLFGEGLAVYNEVLTNTMTRSAYENYLLRLRAVEHIEKSFREIYDILRGHGASEKKSYLITYRVKRGLPDTSKPGGFPKDASYLLGYKEVYDFIQKGGRYESLYLSRVPDLGQLLLKYNLLKPKHFYLPSFYQKKS